MSVEMEQLQMMLSNLVTTQNNLIQSIQNLTKLMESQVTALNALAASNEMMAHTVLDVLTEDSGLEPVPAGPTSLDQPEHL